MNDTALLTEAEWNDIEIYTQGADGPMAYRCPEKGCQCSFDPERHLILDHLEDVHGVTPDGVQQTYRCYYCEIEGERRSEIVAHVRDEHIECVGDRAGGDSDDEWHPWEGR